MPPCPVEKGCSSRTFLRARHQSSRSGRAPLISSLEDSEYVKRIQPDGHAFIPSFVTQIFARRGYSIVGVLPLIPSIDVPMPDRWYAHQVLGRINLRSRKPVLLS